MRKPFPNLQKRIRTVDPNLRRPLKNNIIADLQKDGFPVAYEVLAPTIAWYESHFAYKRAKQAGAKKIDLDGKEVGTVTLLEQRNAEKYIAERKQQRCNTGDAIQTMTSLHRARKVPDDALRKITLDREISPPQKTVDPFESLQKPLDAVRHIMLTTPDPILRVAFAAAGLKVVIAEAQRMINKLQGSP